MPPQKSLLLGDDRLALGGLTRILEGLGWKVVGALQSAHQWSRWVELLPDVAICDFESFDSDRALIELTELTSGELPTLALVDDPDRARDALSAGARGILSRDVEANLLSTALQSVAMGLLVMDPDLARSSLRDGPSGSLGPDPLTPREREALELLAIGLTNKQIADRLGVSPHTAKFHVNSLLAKLGARSRTEAIAIAARAGLVSF